MHNLKSVKILKPLAVVLISALLPLSAWAGDTAAHVSKRTSTPDDIAAINKVLEDFMLAIKTKNGKQLSALVLNSNIMFTSPGDQKRVDSVREFDVNFDGVGTGGFLAFSKFITNSTENNDEKYYNVQITQDGPLAWVLFDYEFYADGKVKNYGVEHWQMRKTDGNWKIFSVIWSQNEAKTSN